MGKGLVSRSMGYFKLTADCHDLRIVGLADAVGSKINVILNNGQVWQSLTYFVKLVHLLLQSSNSSFLDDYFHRPLPLPVINSVCTCRNMKFQVVFNFFSVMIYFLFFLIPMA